MRANGQLRTCDRCGEAVFFKTTGEKEMDGGFTRWNTFEKAEGWSVEIGIGDLCPACTIELEVLKEKFKQQKTRQMEQEGNDK